MTSLLVDRLGRSAYARIINVASETQARAYLDLDDLQYERRPYSMRPVYGQSKLGVVLFTAELACRLGGSGLTANSLHPGLVASNLGRRDGLTGLVWPLVSRFMTSPPAAARHVTHLATSPDVVATTGAYFDKERRARPNPIAEDPLAARRLWDVLETLAQVPRRLPVRASDGAQ